MSNCKTGQHRRHTALPFLPLVLPGPLVAPSDLFSTFTSMLCSTRRLASLLPALVGGARAATAACDLVLRRPLPGEGGRQQSSQSSAPSAEAAPVDESWWREVQAAGDDGEEEPTQHGRRFVRVDAPIDAHRTLNDYRKMVFALSQRKRCAAAAAPPACCLPVSFPTEGPCACTMLVASGHTLEWFCCLDAGPTSYATWWTKCRSTACGQTASYCRRVGGWDGNCNAPFGALSCALRWASRRRAWAWRGVACAADSCARACAPSPRAGLFSCMKSRKLGDAMYFFEEMKRRGMQPDVSSRPRAGAAAATCLAGQPAGAAGAMAPAAGGQPCWKAQAVGQRRCGCGAWPPRTHTRHPTPTAAPITTTPSRTRPPLPTPCLAAELRVRHRHQRLRACGAAGAGGGAA